MLDVQRWELRDGGRFCVVHRLAFGLTESCGGCEADPGPPPTAAVPMRVHYPRGCASAEQVWRELGKDLDVMLAAREELLGKKAALERAEKNARGRTPKAIVMTPKLASGLVKIQDSITKIRRLQRELAEKHFDDAFHNALLEEQMRAHARGGRN